MSEQGYWRPVTIWCDGGNQDFGTCARTAIGNRHVTVTTFNGNPEVMPPGEIEYGYAVETGWTPLDPTTDHGEQLVHVLREWTEKGWPGDPSMKPLWWGEVSKEQIADTIREYAGCYAWALLPKLNDEWDFSDDSLRPDITGTGAHAVEIVGADDRGLFIVTWGRVVQVSRAWWGRYGHAQFAYLHPAWRRPA